MVLLSGDAASNVYNAVPDSLRAAIFTLLVLTGASIASAYIRYERELFRLRWLVDHDPPSEAERPGAHWPNDAEAFWIGGLTLFLVTAATFVAACWVPAFT